MNYRPPGSSVHGILQARILEWVAIAFSRGSSWHRDRTLVSCIEDRFFTFWATSCYILYDFLKNFYWSVIAVQCCVGFCSTKKWICYMYRYIPSRLDLFTLHPTHLGHHRAPSWVYSGFSLAVSFAHGRVCMSIPVNPGLPVHPIPLVLLVSACLFSVSVCIPALCSSFICTIFLDSTCMC